jgi:hypothetical protein
MWKIPYYKGKRGKMQQPMGMMWIVVAFGVSTLIFSIVVDIPYTPIIPACVFSFVLGVGYTYRCLFCKFDEVTNLQNEVLAIKMQLVEKSLDDTLTFFEGLQEKEENGGTVH